MTFLLSYFYPEEKSKFLKARLQTELNQRTATIIISIQ